MSSVVPDFGGMNVPGSILRSVIRRFSSPMALRLMDSGMLERGDGPIDLAFNRLPNRLRGIADMEFVEPKSTIARKTKGSSATCQ